MHFKHLFSLDNSKEFCLNTKTTFPLVNQDSLTSLASIPSNDEIRNAVFSIGPYKAPGYDGFLPIFFRANWETVGSSFCKFVLDFFKGSSSTIEANKTLISVIPKTDKPELVSHFRPISLCSVHYKSITKIIVARLKGLMDTLISLFQAGFVPGCQIQDNIIIGQKIMHIMKKARKKKVSSQ